MSLKTTLDVDFAERLEEQQVAEESISTRASGVGVSSIGATRAGRKDPNAGGMPLSFDSRCAVYESHTADPQL